MSISEDLAAGGDPVAGSRPGPGTLGVHRFARPASALKLQLLTVATLLAVGTSLSAWWWLDHVLATGLVAVLLGVAAAMWVAWFGEPASTVRVEYGALVVVSGDREQRVDIAGADLRVSSTPGQRGWRATFRQFDQRPVVVDSSMVDGPEFTQVLARWRPDLLDLIAPPAPGAP